MIDLMNQRFGRLRVAWPIGTKQYRLGHRRQTLWLCFCDCGNSTFATTTVLRAQNGQCKRSCGCLAHEQRKRLAKRIKDNPPRLRHGHWLKGRATRTYNSWICMKSRCYYKKDKDYHNYGGRGIRVCKRWKNSFENFLADMGLRPKGKTLDRIENNGNYEPGNCRWATRLEQYRNRRNVRMAER